MRELRCRVWDGFLDQLLVWLYWDGSLGTLDEQTDDRFGRSFLGDELVGSLAGLLTGS